MNLPQHILDLNPELIPVKKQLSLAKDGYRSSLEKKAASQWIPFMFKWWMYEPFKLNFPGGSYTPDFFGELVDGELAVVEVKGWNKNLRADRLKYNVSLETHLWLKFCWLTHDKDGGWHDKWDR